MSFYKNIGTFKVWKQGLPVDVGLIYKKKSSNTLYEIVDVTDRGVLAHGRCSGCCFSTSCCIAYKNIIEKIIPPCKPRNGRSDNKIVYFKQITK